MNIRLFSLFAVILLLAVNGAIVLLGMQPCSYDATRGFVFDSDLCPAPTNRNCDIERSAWKKENIWLIKSYPGIDNKCEAPRYAPPYYRLSRDEESYQNPHLPDPVVRSFPVEVIEESGGACGGTAYRSSSGNFIEIASGNEHDIIMRSPETDLCYDFSQCFWKCSGTVYGWKRVIVNEGHNDEYESFVDGTITDLTCASGGFEGKKYEHQIVSCYDDGDI